VTGRASAWVAREVHDVVSHGLAVINVQASVALHLIRERPDQAKVALAGDQDHQQGRAGRAARHPGGVPASRGVGAPRRPAPGLDQLESLTADMAGSGLPVQLQVTGERTGLPSTVDLAAYRLVQESLTNELRHAGTARAMVRVTYHLDTVDLEITDGRGPPPVRRGPPVIRVLVADDQALVPAVRGSTVRRRARPADRARSPPGGRADGTP
jgi:signal transduction histidine kinase